MGDNRTNIIVGIPLALLAISIAWCPKVFQFIMKPSSLGTPAQAVEVESGGVAVTQMAPGKNARGKATIISSFFKLLSIPFVAAMFCYFYDIADLSRLNAGFDGFKSHRRGPFPHFMVQIFTSLIGYLWGTLACSMCMQRPAFLLPLLLATPISVSIVLVPVFGGNDYIPFQHGDYSDPLVYVALGCLLLAQFFSVGYVFSEQAIIMAKDSSLFWKPTYNGKELNSRLTFMSVAVRQGEPVCPLEPTLELN